MRRFGKSRGLFLTILAFAAVASAAVGGDWPRSLGPFDNYTADTTFLVDAFPEAGPKVLWRAKTSPTLAGVTVATNYVFTVGVAAGASLKDAPDGRYPNIPWKFKGDVEVVVTCLDAVKGGEVWHYGLTMPASFPVFDWEAKTDADASAATVWSNYYGPKAPPTVDGGRVYVLLHDGTLLCLRATTGERVFSVPVREKYQGRTGRFGYAGAPLVTGKWVIVPAYGEDCCLVALDRATGELGWKGGTMGDTAGIRLADGKSASQPRCDGYSSPVLAKIMGVRQVVHFTGGGLQGISLEDGHTLWNYPMRGGTREVVPEPLVDGARVYAGSTYCPQGEMVDLSHGEPQSAWKNGNLRNHFSNIVLGNGCLFGSSGNYRAATYRCVDARDGALLWSTDFRDDPEGNVKEQAMTILADGKLVILTAYGEIVLAKAEREGFAPLGRFRLAERGAKTKFWPHPALASGRFYCQDTAGGIWCIDLRK